MTPPLRGPASVGWQGSADPQHRGIRLRQPLVDRTLATKKPRKTKSGAQTSLCFPQPPTERHRRDGQTTDWPLCQASDQNRRFFVNRSHDSGGTSAAHFYTLPPGSSNRARSIHIKKNLSKPFPFSTPCPDSRPSSSSLSLSLLASPPNSRCAHSSKENEFFRYSSFQILLF
jgi:hypothetical protein